MQRVLCTLSTKQIKHLSEGLQNSRKSSAWNSTLPFWRQSHSSLIKTERWKSSSRNNFPGSTSKPRGSRGCLCSCCVGEWPIMNIPILMQQLMCSWRWPRGAATEGLGLEGAGCHLGAAWALQGGSGWSWGAKFWSGGVGVGLLPVWAIRAAMCVGVEVLNRFFIGKVIGVHPRNLFHRTAVTLLSGLSTAHRHLASCWQILVCALPCWFAARASMYVKTKNVQQYFCSLGKCFLSVFWLGKSRAWTGMDLLQGHSQLDRGTSRSWGSF